MLLLIEVDHNFRSSWVRLACKDEAALEFVGLEAVVEIHVDFTFNEFGAAGAAHAALAREREVSPPLQRRVEHRHAVIRQFKLHAVAVKHDFNGGGAGFLIGV